jgi:hypothetical protein
MLEVLDLGPHVLAYRVEGKIDRQDIERVFAELDRMLATESKLRVYAEVQSFSGITLDALWQDIRLGIQRLNVIPRIEKAALVTDTGWLRKAATVEDKILRGLELRTFSLDEAVEAQAWLQL